MFYLRIFVLFNLLVLLACEGFGKENVDSNGDLTNKKGQEQLKAGCSSATAEAFLDVNNVRALILNGGDMWWDLVNTARYIVPNQDEPPFQTSLFAGSLWIGGYDQGNNLRAAAMTYRQGQGYDFFPGPLDTTDATITSEECNRWDRIWKVNQEDIEEMDRNTQDIPRDIREWPTRGNPAAGQTQSLAPFNDENDNGIYEPNQGETPDILGDQALYFVYNDKGNIHTETQASAIGLEVQTMAFAFSSADEIDNMTFYQHKVVNRSTNRLDSVHFGQWVDPDLGFAFDDYVGCDTSRDLGICYNGDDFDEGVNGYGSNPPSVGVDFFQGPTTRDGEQLGMDYFVYYNNDFSQQGNPEQAQHYYNYLTGTWKDGERITCGDDGKGGDERCNYMFPDDPNDRSDDAWSEVTAGNEPGDRRFLQSSGPFTLMPGAVNTITTGVVWAKASSGGNTGSLDLLRIADDKAQELYNNDFNPLDGPDLPEVTTQELDEKIIIRLDSTGPTENYFTQALGEDVTDTIEYLFQGYQIYQLESSSVSQSNLDDADQARVVRQVDLEDEVGDLTNQVFNAEVSEFQSELMVQAADDGIDHTFEITTDAFSSGDDALVNNRAYYFAVVPYAAANPNDSISKEADQQYLQSRGVARITAYPHKTEPEKDGAVTQADFGDRPVITRLEGTGNGGMILDLTEETRQAILENGSVEDPTYAVNGGPVNLFVNDPLNVPDANFMFRINDPDVAGSEDFTQIDGDATWELLNLTDDNTFQSKRSIGTNNEQIISEIGMSAYLEATIGPTTDTVTENEGFQEATLTFENQDEVWLAGIPDQDRPSSRDFPYPLDWIRSGKTGADTLVANDKLLDDAVVQRSRNDHSFADPNQVYEGLLGGIVAPYGVTARAGTYQQGSIDMPTCGPALEGSSYDLAGLSNLNSVDLVFTSDKSKWTQCVVVEMSSDPGVAEGGAERFRLREHGSWLDPNAIEDGEPQYVSMEEDKGRSWFPGYAINLETGERLNIIFGEDSRMTRQNGRDMLWNPTRSLFNQSAGGADYDNYLFGGKHYVYIMNTRKTGNPVDRMDPPAYDGGETYQEILQDNSSQLGVQDLYSSAMWVMLPRLEQNAEYNSLEEGLIPTRTEIRLRVDRPYGTYSTEASDENDNLPLYSFNTGNLATRTNEEMGKSAMDMIRAVPNPYYARSNYEQSQLDERVRLTNLPRKCKISIYTLDGNLVREFNRDQTEENHRTFLDWDLRNSANIPIGSGIYLIHVDGFELGETTIKWFGIRRPLDLDTF